MYSGVRADMTRAWVRIALTVHKEEKTGAVTQTRSADMPCSRRVDLTTSRGSYHANK